MTEPLLHAIVEPRSRYKGNYFTHLHELSNLMSALAQLPANRISVAIAASCLP